MSILKVAQISSSIYGGAGIAAHRLQLALNKYPEINSCLIQKLYTYPEDEKDCIYTLYPQQTISYKIKNKLSLTPEVSHQRFLSKNKNNSEMMSLSTTSYRLENIPIVRDANIVQLHWVANFLNYSTFFKNIKQPIVWTLHDMNPFQGLFHYKGDQETYKNILGKLDNRELQKKIKTIHQHNNIHIVCPSNWLKNLSEQSEAFSKYPHYMIPYGLNFDTFPLLDPNKEKTNLNINNNLKTILAIAQNINVHRKGGDLLASAVNKLNMPCNLITIGGAKLDINSHINHIHFEHVSELSKLNALYSAADLMVLSSREDNLPCVMLESFANGTPVLSFSNGGMTEHIETGKTGILLQNINSEDLLNGLVDFINDKYNFDREYIRNYARNHFSEAQQADKYIQLYKDILKTK